MSRPDGSLILSPTDLTRHQACPHATTLDLAVADGRLKPPLEGPPHHAALVADLGTEHELRYLDALEAEGRSIVRIPARFDAAGRREAEAMTLQAMRAGVDVVAQASFFDGTWGGAADFLLRVETPANLGAWSYEVADGKPARRVKVPALLQMATYADRLPRPAGGRGRG